MASNEYIAALESKLAEATGVSVDAIRKNQMGDLNNEGESIAESIKFINSICVQKTASATSSVANPLIQQQFDLIKRELGQDAGSAALPPLPYAYDALEPHICGEIMTLHHSKHHQGYANNINTANGKLDAAKAANDNAALNALTGAVLFNGGGHLNHSIFWTNMKPNKTDDTPVPSGTLAEQINKDFGSFEQFKSQFTSTTAAVKGSGWGWLALKAGKLGIFTTQNQDTCELMHAATPILACDVWEHAYYIQYKNLRAKYLDAWFKVVNWENVQQRFDNAK